MTTVAVVGAGLAGLAAAHRLRRLRPDLDVVVLEAADRNGGKVRTSTFGGLPVDEAADAFLVRTPTVLDLCSELGLADRLVHPSDAGALVWVDGALRRLPAGTVLGVPTDLDAVAESGLISPGGLARAAEDLTRSDDRPPPGPDGDDESVGSLVRRRLGDEVYEVLVAPLLGGVNAGDADDLSVEAGAPQLAAARHHRSLIEGLRSLRAGAPATGAPIFAGLRGGTQTLTDALVAAIGTDRVRTGTPVTTLGRTGDGYRLSTPGGAVHADAVVLAVPSFVLAPLLADLVPDAAAGLADLEWASVAMVRLAVPAGRVGRPLDATGFLVPRHAGLLLTACSFGSTKWPQWASEGQVVLRASAGRIDDGRHAALTDGELVRALWDDLTPLLDLRGEPTEADVCRWPRALPQYRPGHRTRVARWRAAVAEALPGVELAGASFDGLGLPAVAADGERAARALAGSGGHRPSDLG